MIGAFQLVNALVLLGSFFGNNMATIIASVKSRRNDADRSIGLSGDEEGIRPTWIDIFWRYAVHCLVVFVRRGCRARIRSRVRIGVCSALLCAKKAWPVCR